MIGKHEQKNPVIEQAEALKLSYDTAFVEHGANAAILRSKTNHLTQQRLEVEGYRADADSIIDKKIGCLAAHIISREIEPIERDVRTLSHTVEADEAKIDNALDESRKHARAYLDVYIAYALSISPGAEQMADSQVA